MTTLQVYVAGDCLACAESRRLIAELEQDFPQVVFQVIDATLESLPEHVFATPTFALDGRIIALGNPSPQTLTAMIRAAENPPSQ